MSVLDPVTHARLIEEIEEVARDAGIPKRYIEESASAYCSKDEIEWLMGVRQHHLKGQFGLCFQGRDHLQEMMAMAGALTRNFILARVTPLADIIEMLRSNDPIDATVLFVPSFHRAASKGSITPFQVNLLWNLLEERMMAERQTVIGIHSIQQLKVDYGPHFADLMTNHYMVL